MKKIIIHIILFIIILQYKAISQENIFSIGLWKFNSINGLVALEGNYREQSNTLRDNFYDKQQSSIFKGMFKLKTNSFFWNPKFLILDTYMEYCPNAVNDNFIVMPNRTESTNAENFGVSALFFSTKEINLSLSYNTGISYTMRDYGSSVKMDQNTFGSSIIYSNSFAPAMVSYNKTKSEQKDLTTQRSYIYDKTNFSGSISKTMFEVFTNRLMISQDIMNYENYDLTKTNINLNEIRFNNELFFDKSKENIITSNFTYFNQTGYFNQQKYLENLMFKSKITNDLGFISNYFYDQTNQGNLLSKTNSLSNRLDHQLYQSLHSFVYFQYFNAINFSSEETRNFFGIGFDYSKIITGGQLQIKYEFKFDRNKRTSGNIQNIVKNEEIFIDDLKPSLLQYPYIIESSIIVKDVTQTIIYQLNADFLIQNRGNYTELIRIPGGRINNQSKIYVDYYAENPANYSYDMIGHSIYSKISFLDKMLDVYSQFYTNDFKNAVYSEFTVLNKITSKLLGLQANYEDVNLGYEINLYESNIMPYTSNYLFLRYSKTFYDDFLVSAFANYNNYHYTDTQEDNQFMDANMRLVYRISERSNLNLEFGYMNQQTNNFISNFVNFRAVYAIKISKLLLSTGVDMYHRKVEANQTDYNGIFIKIEREF
jgi:hypothetical protein